ncbi:arabinoxylan arabinofuranohydrolase [Parabacteroides sp. PFB2-10]|nr:arabinoxylan arabinofuranohydrolase [Parabacteroides sp. PFB2-10]
MSKNNCKFGLAILFFVGIMPFVQIHAQSRPVVQTSYTADPAPLVHNGTVYLYTGHDEDEAPPGQSRFLMKEWLLYSSTDMVNWTDHGAVASLKDFAWVKNPENGAWASQCIEHKGKFYFYCSTPGGTGMGVLVADSPFGPFKDPIGKPLIKNSHEDIDPSVYVDDDGQAYIYWGNPNLWYAKLNDDMISISGDIIKDPLVRKTKGQPDPYHYQEGPWTYKRGDHYYMAYASTCCPEGIGYAMGPTAIGPWEFKGYIMPPDRRATGNHPGIIDYKGKSYVFGFNFWLNFQVTDKHHERRSVCVSEITYNPDGTIQELPWWEEGKPVDPVGTLNPYKRTEAETISWSEGLKTKRNTQTGMYVTSVHNNDYIRLQAVDFKKGAKSFEVSAAAVRGGKIEIRLDAVDGTLLGVCDITQSGSQDAWKTFTTKVKKEKGVHDLYFVFKGGEGELFNLDYWKFK